MIITICRKPFSGSVIENIKKNQCGGINVDACRIICGDETFNEKLAYVPSYNNKVYGKGMGGGAWENINGRFPSNLLLSEEASFTIDQQSGVLKSGALSPQQYSKKSGDNRSMFFGQGMEFKNKGYESNEGGASRYFKVIKW